MEKYKINWIEQKTGKSGKNYWVMHLVDSTGKETQNVSTFEDKYQAGMEVEGQIIQNGNYLNWKPKLEAPAFIKANSGYRAQQIEKAVERKETSIKGFQDNKEWSIKVSSTMRDAVLLSIAEGKPNSDNILRWREWLWNNWDVAEDQYPPFIDKE